MPFFMRVSPFLSMSLILAHARPENLFTSEPPQFNLDAPFDDASLQLNSNDVSSESTSLFLDPSDQEIGFSSDMDSFGNSNNLLASNSMDLTVLPDCKSVGSQTNGGLQARDEYCPPQGTIDLPTDLFKDPLEYLRDNLGTPLRGQTNQPGQGVREDENTNSIYSKMQYQPNEEQCPTRLFRTSNIPVCENPLTGALQREIGSNAFRAFNVVPYPPACPEFSQLLCCSSTTTRPFLPEEAFNPSRFDPEERAFLSRLGVEARDGRYCWWAHIVLMMNWPVDTLEYPQDGE